MPTANERGEGARCHRASLTSSSPRQGEKTIKKNPGKDPPGGSPSLEASLSRDQRVRCCRLISQPIRSPEEAAGCLGRPRDVSSPIANPLRIRLWLSQKEEAEVKEEKSEEEGEEQTDEEENPRHSILERVAASVRSLSFR